MYIYMLVHYILSSCMVKLFFSVSINNLVFSSVDDMLHVLHYMYLAKCFQYIITLSFFMCSLHVVYSTFFKSLLHMALTGKVCYKYYYNIMHVKKTFFKLPTYDDAMFFSILVCRYNYYCCVVTWRLTLVPLLNSVLNAIHLFMLELQYVYVVISLNVTK